MSLTMRGSAIVATSPNLLLSAPPSTPRSRLLVSPVTVFRVGLGNNDVKFCNPRFPSPKTIAYICKFAGYKMGAVGYQGYLYDAGGSMFEL